MHENQKAAAGETPIEEVLERLKNDALMPKLFTVVTLGVHPTEGAQIVEVMCAAYSEKQATEIVNELLPKFIVGRVMSTSLPAVPFKGPMPLDEWIAEYGADVANDPTLKQLVQSIHDSIDQAKRDGQINVA